MTAHLLEMHQAIEHDRQELESTVCQRTEELNRKNQALALQNEEILEASRLKSDFLANMSHELRTPLNAILALSELLRDEVSGPLANDEQRRQTSMIHQSGESLLHLINDVLDLSKIEAGRLDIRWQETDLAELLSEAVEKLRPLAARKGLDLRLRVDPSRPLFADPDRIHQVVLNLLGNAIKFTDRGRIEVRGTVDEQDERFTVSVMDTGVGIAPHDHEHIFHEFRQLEGSATRRHGGTGLGLAISRRLAHLLGGDITLQSDLGQGSVFTFFAPVYREHPARGNGSAVTSGGRLPASILVLDDDPIEREALRSGLARLGYQVHLAGTGPEAISLLDRERPNLVVLDLAIPGMSGFEALDLMTERIGRPALPIMINTGKDLSREERAALEDRVDWVFRKGDGGPGAVCEEIHRVMEGLARGIEGETMDQRKAA
jgi:signal transduction histidine kinase/CheY-like chemotaxis protein